MLVLVDGFWTGCWVVCFEGGLGVCGEMCRGVWSRVKVFQWDVEGSWRGLRSVMGYEQGNVGS